MTTTEYQVYNCQSWEDFAGHLKGKGRSAINERLYRGQRNPADLLSSVWEREVREKRASAEGLEEELNKFKQIATGLPGVDTDGMKFNTEWWILGRHHGQSDGRYVTNRP